MWKINFDKRQFDSNKWTMKKKTFEKDNLIATNERWNFVVEKDNLIVINEQWKVASI